jgi:hypothetical protein
MLVLAVAVAVVSNRRRYFGGDVGSGWPGAELVCCLENGEFCNHLPCGCSVCRMAVTATEAVVVKQVLLDGRKVALD